MKAYKIIHITANIIAFGALLAYLVYAVIVWNDIPDTIGVHFASGSGEAIADFDIFGSKWFVLYPFAAGFLLLGLFSLGGHIANKVDLGLKVDEKGTQMIRASVNLYLDALKLGWGIFFAHWADCVIHQHGLYTLVPIIGIAILFFGLLVLSVSLFIIRISRSGELRDEVRKEKPIGSRALVKDTLVYRTAHMVTNVVSFTALTGYLIFMIIVWWNMPDKIGVHFGPESSPGLANFDIYGDKVFAFYPFWAGFGLMVIFTLLQFAAGKVRIGLKTNDTGDSLIRAYVILYLDLHKVVWAAFFSHWARCVIQQVPLHTIIPLIGFILLAVGTLVLITAIIVFRIRYREDKAELEAKAEVNTEDAGIASMAEGDNA